MLFTLKDNLFTVKIYFMTKNQQTKSLFKIMVCAFFGMVLSSFQEDQLAPPDPCAPTDAQVRANCEYSSLETCTLTWSGGTCTGTYYYPYNRAKQ